MNRYKRCALALFFFFLMTLLLSSCAGEVLPSTLDATPRTLCLALDGPIPEAEDFLSDSARAYLVSEGVDIRLEGELDTTREGSATLTLVLKDARGRVQRLKAGYMVVRDVTPPTLSGVCDRSVLLGEGAVLREGVTAADDCFGTVELTVDTRGLDTSRRGCYSVLYTATDASGNQAEQTAYVSVYEREITSEELWEACDGLLAEILTPDMSKEEICRTIYATVQERVLYLPLGDQTDWVRVGYEALFVLGRGDCFSFFAAAKALLTRAGIETLDVERVHAPGEETHYWLMVDLGEQPGQERWYHFDPTEVDPGTTEHDGCLFTDRELDEYNAQRPGFYAYDREAYPATAQTSLRTP